jgi:dienelactone hydrolase
MFRIPLLLASIAFAQWAQAGQPLVYQDGATRCAGYVAFPAKAAGPVPGVLIIHQWMGLTDHERGVADQLAELGYVALAVDIFGEGVRPKNAQEAGAQAGLYRGDRALYLRRIRAGLDALKSQTGVDPGRLAAIGFCFGGTGALEAARGNLPVKGVVSFHGGLDSPADRPVGPISARILICHGADDPHVTAKDVEAFQEEMRKAKADYVFIAYGGAVHGFTQKGPAYQEAAAHRSWQHMKDFFKEIF